MFGLWKAKTPQPSLEWEDTASLSLDPAPTCTCLDYTLYTACSCKPSVKLSQPIPVQEKDEITHFMEMVWEDAEYQALAPLKISYADYAQQTMTEDQKNRLGERALEIYDRILPDALVQFSNSKMKAQDRQMQADILASIQSVKAAVDRSAVAANAIDFARRHPFLAGLFGRTLFDKIRG
jgi:hypothetical protein